jgi:MFS family permease
VLVLEIAAGRLLAPYVGVSLTTYTGIIGAILAGIAAGAWVGGRLADRYGPEPLLGPTLILGGWAAIASVPVVAVVGGLGLGDGVLAILTLATIGFVLPAILLSAVGPMLVRATLVDLATSGTVVGRLSAIGTAGAITGTFVTGFVLLGLVPTRPLIVGVGVLLALIGLAVTWWLRGDARQAAILAAGSALLGVAALVVPSPCDTETTYYCVDVRSSASDPAERRLILDGLTHAAVNLDDPTDLRLGYVRRFADASASVLEAIDGGVHALHIGGGGFSFPRYLDATIPGMRQTVLELDPAIVSLAREELGFEPSERVTVVTGDARRSIETLPAATYELVVGDAFGGLSVPWHLTTDEFIAEIHRVLAPGGRLVMNLIDGPELRFVSAEVATLLLHFEHVTLVAGSAVLDGGGGNVVLVASDVPIDGSAIREQVATWGENARTEVIHAPLEGQAFFREARPLTDDFAPVDQLLGR